MDVILYIAAAILSLLGLVTVIRAIVYSLFTTGWEKSLYHIVCLKDENAEMALRDAIEQIDWHHCGKTNEILAVDMGMNPMTHEICRLICHDFSIQLCDISELEEAVKAKFCKATGD